MELTKDIFMADEYHVPTKKEFYSFWYEDGAEVPDNAVKLTSESVQLSLDADGKYRKVWKVILNSINPERVIRKSIQ